MLFSATGASTRCGEKLLLQPAPAQLKKTGFAGAEVPVEATVCPVPGERHQPREMSGRTVPVDLDAAMPAACGRLPAQPVDCHLKSVPVESLVAIRVGEIPASEVLGPYLPVPDELPGPNLIPAWSGSNGLKSSLLTSSREVNQSVSSQGW